jgi:hypothetical protein
MLLLLWVCVASASLSKRGNFCPALSGNFTYCTNSSSTDQPGACGGTAHTKPSVNATDCQNWCETKSALFCQLNYTSCGNDGIIANKLSCSWCCSKVAIGDCISCSTAFSLQGGPLDSGGCEM